MKRRICLKDLIITEKPSVAQEYAKALKMQVKRNDGYIEDDKYIITWCVGHLISMSYPERYDQTLKKWSLDTLPFIPNNFLYEVIPNVKKQFEVVKKQLNRNDIRTIYYGGDAAREGLYIESLVRSYAGHNMEAEEKQIWIDSQTEDEILRGIRDAGQFTDYQNLIDSGYLRAIEDYLIGINFSRALSLKYGYILNTHANTTDYAAISIGRVMTCVLGMVVDKEREIRNFIETPFYRVVSTVSLGEANPIGEWRAVEGSSYYNSNLLYKENGFKKIESAKALINELEEDRKGIITNLEKKKEMKNAPLLYNLAELQNDCSKIFKISPDETLQIVQELYEKKLMTYPRTDARVLSTAVAKEIFKNINGLKSYDLFNFAAGEIIENKWFKDIINTKYTNDKMITDHYAIIPTGQGLSNLNGLSQLHKQIFELITRRFLSIFYPAATYHKINLVYKIKNERFFTSCKVLVEKGYLKISQPINIDENEDNYEDSTLLNVLAKLEIGKTLHISDYSIKEGKTSPPKHYTSGSMILAMENAGQLIEEVELREQLKGSGIGTSATRAEILNKLVKNKYLNLNKKTQIISPTMLGEMVYEIVDCTVNSVLNPKLTASWEKGLTYVAEGNVKKSIFLEKIEEYIRKLTTSIKDNDLEEMIIIRFKEVKQYYNTSSKKKRRDNDRHETHKL